LEKKTQEINLSVLGRTIVRRVWIIILATIICAAGMFIYAKNYVTPTYRASVQMYVNNTSQLAAEGKYIPYSELTAAQSLVKTYVAILDTYDTIREVVSYSGLNYSYEQMRGMLSAEAINETELFEVSVVADTPEDAATLANAVASVLPNRIATFVEGSSVSVVQRAVLPTSPYAPNLVKYALTGALVGLFISLAAIVVVELVDNRIKEEDYVAEQYGTRTLATIPDLLGSSDKSKKQADGDASDKLLCDSLGFNAAEAYKMLRTNLLSVITEENGAKAFGVTSPEPCDGKSTMAINFAYTLAQTGKRVLLVEADLRKPVVAKRLKLSASKGFSDLLLGREGDFIKPSGYFDNWDVLCAGKSAETPRSC
jgi:capsular polysaccharide biosynthesis protein